MNTLRELLQDYLAMRRALGFKLRTEGTGLISFVAFSEERQADHISIALALSWATQPASVQAYRSAQRLSYVRGFARYCSAFDARTVANCYTAIELGVEVVPVLNKMDLPQADDDRVDHAGVRSLCGRGVAGFAGLGAFSGAGLGLVGSSFGGRRDEDGDDRAVPGGG